MINDLLLIEASKAKISGKYPKCISLSTETIKQSENIETKLKGLSIRSCARYYLLKQGNLSKASRILIKIGAMKDLNFVLEKSTNIRMRTSAMEILMLLSSAEEKISTINNLGIFEVQSSALSQQEKKSLIISLENAQYLALLKRNKHFSVREIKDKLLSLHEEVPENNPVLAGIILKNAAMCRLLIRKAARCPKKRLDERLKAIELLNKALELYPAEEIAHINSAKNILRMINQW